jgi:hypothetical protein
MDGLRLAECEPELVWRPPRARCFCLLPSAHPLQEAASAKKLEAAEESKSARRRRARPPHSVALEEAGRAERGGKAKGNQVGVGLEGSRFCGNRTAKRRPLFPLLPWAGANTVGGLWIWSPPTVSLQSPPPRAGGTCTPTPTLTLTLSSGTPGAGSRERQMIRLSATVTSKFFLLYHFFPLFSPLFFHLPQQSPLNTPPIPHYHYKISFSIPTINFLSTNNYSWTHSTVFRVMNSDTLNLGGERRGPTRRGRCRGHRCGYRAPPTRRMQGEGAA